LVPQKSNLLNSHTPASNSSLKKSNLPLPSSLPQTPRLIHSLPNPPPTKKFQPPQFLQFRLSIRSKKSNLPNFHTLCFSFDAQKSNLLLFHSTNQKAQGDHIRAVRLVLRKIQPPELLKGLGWWLVEESYRFIQIFTGFLESEDEGGNRKVSVSEG
jgi:hypothetical protein